MTKVLIDLGISLNGMIARDNGDEDWLPESGWDDFLKQIDKYQNVIVGRKTYELVKEKYEHDNFDAIKTKLKIIISSQSDYKAPNTDYTVVRNPEDAVNIVKQAGLETAYVGGGGEICAAFFNAKLVDRLQLTIFPYIIPIGRSFVSSTLNNDVALKLLETNADEHGQITNIYGVSR